MTREWQTIRSQDKDGIGVDVLLSGDVVSEVLIRLAPEAPDPPVDGFSDGKDTMAERALDAWNRDARRTFRVNAVGWQYGFDRDDRIAWTTVETRFLASLSLEVMTDQRLTEDDQHSLVKQIVVTLSHQAATTLIPGAGGTAVLELQAALEVGVESLLVYNAHREAPKEAFIVPAR